MCKSFNEVSVMTHNSSKGLDVSVGLRRGACDNGGHVFLRGLNSILAHVMSQINELCPEQVTLGRLKFEAVLSEAVKYDPHLLEMLLWSLGVDYDII